MLQHCTRRLATRMFRHLSYKIDDCILDRGCILRISDAVDSETIDRLLNHLQEKDFTGEMEQIDDSMYNHSARDNIYGATLANLQKMVDNKEVVFSKVFVKENLKLNIDADNVSFDWFQFTA